MNDERFSELLRTMRLMKSNDPNFAAEKLVDFSEFSDEQKMQVEKEFGKRKKMWIPNSLYYNYFDNDDF